MVINIIIWTEISNRTFSMSLIMLFNAGNGAFEVTVVLLLALSQISNHSRWYRALGLF